MSRYNEEVWILITRRFSGESTSEEKGKLQEWLREDPKNKEFYNRIEASWSKRPGESVDSFYLSFQFDYEKGLKRLRNKIDQTGGSAYQNNHLNNRSYKLYVWKLAAAIMVVAITLFVYVNIQNWDHPNTSSYATSSVEQRIITLSDGSVVRLNQDSKLKVTEYPRDESRTIQLKGEAFFDIVNNTDRTFKIQVGEAVVEVLGTSFNIKEGREIMVAVQEGLVDFRHQNNGGKSTARLTAGQIGLLSKNGSDIKIEQTSVENYMSWIHGYLRFSNMPFEDAMRQLSRIYDINYEVRDSTINSLQLTVYTESLQKEEILETIAMALNLEFEIEENTIKWIQNN